MIGTLRIGCVMLAACFAVNGQNAALQQSIGGKYAISTIAPDRSSVVAQGASLVLQRDNLLMHAVSCPSSPVSTYNPKKGRLSQPFGRNFGRGMGGSLLMPGTDTTAMCPQRRFVRGTQLWVTRIDVQKDGILFHLFATPVDGPYYGDLQFPFEKGSSPTSGEALALIGEVLTVQAVQPAAQPAPMQATASQVAVASLSFPSTFVSTQAAADQLKFNADNTFSLQMAGQTYQGTFKVDGNTVELSMPPDTKSVATLQGNQLTDANGQTWIRQGQ